MKSTRFILRVSIASVLALTIVGCTPIKMSVNFRNGTTNQIVVTSAETLRSVQISAGQSKAFPHSRGDLIVTTTANQQFRFEDVAPASDGSDSPFTTSRDAFGPIAGKFVLHVLLDTNMDLFAVLPGHVVVENMDAQPVGYPKRALELPKQQ